LAFSDVKSLTRENITIGINNQRWLRTKRKKTGNPSEIPLLQVPIAIIKKYENDPICVLEQKLLPVGSNQKMNAYLKEIADLCNIKKNLSTHTARHFCYNRNSNTRGFNGGCFKNARPFESLYNKAICTNCGYTYN